MSQPSPTDTPATSDLLLSAEQVCAGYLRPVVGPVSFRLRRGEILGIWGDNGAGKSTLLRVLIGEARCFSGNLQLHGEPLVGVQGQHKPGLQQMPFTVREFLVLANASVDPALLPARLQGCLNRRLDRLSGGQLQLARVWAALSSPADLVLLDEPTNNLDRDGIACVEDMILHHQSRQGVLLISHEHAFMERVCTQLLEIGGAPVDITPAASTEDKH